MVKRDDVENYETCLSILYQLVFLEKKGFSSLSSSSSLSSPSQKVVSEWSPFDIRQEFLRLGFHESGYWQISDLNRGMWPYDDVLFSYLFCFVSVFCFYSFPLILP